jgi:hypothetical protein
MSLYNSSKGDIMNIENKDENKKYVSNINKIFLSSESNNNNGQNIMNFDKDPILKDNKKLKNEDKEVIKNKGKYKIAVIRDDEENKKINNDINFVNNDNLLKINLKNVNQSPISSSEFTLKEKSKKANNLETDEILRLKSDKNSQTSSTYKLKSKNSVKLDFLKRDFYEIDNLNDMVSIMKEIRDNKEFNDKMQDYISDKKKQNDSKNSIDLDLSKDFLSKLEENISITDVKNSNKLKSNTHIKSFENNNNFHISKESRDSVKNLLNSTIKSDNKQSNVVNDNKNQLIEMTKSKVVENHFLKRSKKIDDITLNKSNDDEVDKEIKILKEETNNNVNQDQDKNIDLDNKNHDINNNFDYKNKSDDDSFTSEKIINKNEINILKESVMNCFKDCFNKCNLKTNKLIDHCKKSSLCIFHVDSKVRLICSDISTNYYFDLIMSIFVIYNCINLVLDSPRNDPEKTLYKYLKISSVVFTIIFFFEMLIKVISTGFLFRYNKEISINDLNLTNEELKLLNIKKDLMQESIKSDSKDLSVSHSLSEKYQNTNNSNISHNQMDEKGKYDEKQKESEIKIESNPTMENTKLNMTLEEFLKEYLKTEEYVNYLSEKHNIIAENLIKYANIAIKRYSNKKAYITELFNFVDFCIVVISLVDSFYFLNPKTENKNLSFLQSLKSIRSLRSLRILTKSNNLKIILDTVIKSIPALAKILLPVGSFIIIYSIIGINLFKGQVSFYCINYNIFYDYYVVDGHFNLNSTFNSIKSDKEIINLNIVYNVPHNETECLNLGGYWVYFESNFDNILTTLKTIFELTISEGWLKNMEVALKNVNSKWVYLYFTSYMLVGFFFILNLLISIVVENFNILKNEGLFYSQLTDEEQEWVKLQKVMLKYRPQPKLEFYIEGRNLKIIKILYNIITSKYFDNFISSCVIINTIILMITFNGQSKEFSDILDYVNYFFAIVFTIEVLSKIIVYKKNYFTSSWNIFDFIVVALTDALTIVSVLISLGLFNSNNKNDSIIINESNSEDSLYNPNLFLTNKSSFSDISSISFVRSFRIIRIFRVMIISTTMKSLIDTLIVIIPKIMNVLLVLIITLTIYGIIGVQFFSKIPFREEISEYKNFKTFGNSILTLFISNFGESWNKVMDEAAFHNCTVENVGTEQYNSDYFCVNYKDVFCVEDTSNYSADLLNSCGSDFSFIFIISFQIISPIIIMNLFVVLIIEGYNDSMYENESMLCKENMEEFVNLWMDYDRKCTQSLSPYEFVLVLKQIIPPIGLNYDRFYIEKNRVRNMKKFKSYTKILKSKYNVENGDSIQILRNKGTNHIIINNTKTINLENDSYENENVEIMNDNKNNPDHNYNDDKNILDKIEYKRKSTFEKVNFSKFYTEEINAKRSNSEIISKRKIFIDERYSDKNLDKITKKECQKQAKFKSDKQNYTKFSGNVHIIKSEQNIKEKEYMNNPNYDKIKKNMDKVKNKIHYESRKTIEFKRKKTKIIDLNDNNNDNYDNKNIIQENSLKEEEILESDRNLLENKDEKIKTNENFNENDNDKDKKGVNAKDEKLKRILTEFKTKATFFSQFNSNKRKNTIKDSNINNNNTNEYGKGFYISKNQKFYTTDLEVLDIMKNFNLSCYTKDEFIFKDTKSIYVQREDKNGDMYEFEKDIVVHYIDACLAISKILVSQKYKIKPSKLREKVVAPFIIESVDDKHDKVIVENFFNFSQYRKIAENLAMRIVYKVKKIFISKLNQIRKRINVKDVKDNKDNENNIKSDNEKNQINKNINQMKPEKIDEKDIIDDKIEDLSTLPLKREEIIKNKKVFTTITYGNNQFNLLRNKKNKLIESEINDKKTNEEDKLLNTVKSLSIHSGENQVKLNKTNTHKLTNNKPFEEIFKEFD